MSGFDVVDPRYLELYERARSVLRSDPRVERVELSGSIAAGSADRWSDLDLAVFVHDAELDGFLAEWPSWLAAITPTVFARTPIAPYMVNTVTDEGLTFDLVVRSATGRPVPPQGGYAVGMLSRLRFGRLGDALEYAVAEQLRGLAGPFISLVQREEHLRHLTGAPRSSPLPPLPARVAGTPCHCGGQTPGRRSGHRRARVDAMRTPIASCPDPLADRCVQRQACLLLEGGICDGRGLAGPARVPSQAARRKSREGDGNG